MGDGSAFDFFLMYKSTKIVCTLGPASNTVEIIKKLVEAGMNVARLNFSHGTHEAHATMIENIRAVAEKTGEPIAILQDLCGPKLRIGVLPSEGIVLHTGKIVNFDTAAKKYENEFIPVDCDLHKYVKAGERIFLNDGQHEIKIVSVKNTIITGKIVVGGPLTSHKGINIPDSKIRVSSLTAKDKRDVVFGIKNNVDFVALSFVTSAKDINELRSYITSQEKALSIKVKHPIRIIAKIERREAVDNIDEIIEAADAIMVARGDLGIEIPIQEVPLAQKRIIDKCVNKETPVIVATQMLESMRFNMRPTRAEVSDIANAVIDHTDAVMLSGETAEGKYPVKSVQMMSDIIRETEKSAYDDKPLSESTNTKYQVDDIISSMSRVVAERVGAKVILSASVSGDTGRLLSRYRPNFPLMIGTHSDRVLHQLNLSWGVNPFILEPCNLIEDLIDKSLDFLKKKKIVKKNDKIIVVAGEPIGEAGHVNLLEVRDV